MGLSWPWSYGSWIYNYASISAYHHWCCEFESRSGRGVQHYVIKFVSDLQQVSGFFWVLWFPPPIKTNRHNITEILLKVTLSTIKQTKTKVALNNNHLLYHLFKSRLCIFSVLVIYTSVLICRQRSLILQ
jgi:hypothetical protein